MCSAAESINEAQDISTIFNQREEHNSYKKSRHKKIPKVLDPGDFFVYSWL